MTHHPTHHWQSPPSEHLPPSQHPHPHPQEHLLPQQSSSRQPTPHSLPSHPSQPQPPSAQDAAAPVAPPPPYPTALTAHAAPQPPQPPHPPPAQYMLAVHHPVLTPVAHVPIGAAHYAHLPSSIWAPHTQYHHPAPPRATISRHVHPHLTPATHVYAHPPSQPAAISVHQHGALHPPPHHVNYQYLHHPPQAVKIPVSPPDAHVHQPLVAAYTAAPSSIHAAADGRQLEGKPVAEHANLPAISNHAPSSAMDTLPDADRRATLNGEAIGRNSPLPEYSQRKPQSERSRDDETHKRNASDSERTASQRQRSQQASGQPMRKPRKPYTITKTREVWTPEEHARFLHALTLYDRDWKKIEAYIGTKTVLQIRSHAQKHFGKVTKYKTGEYIPPPRPKKKSALPYPRSRNSAQNKFAAGSNGNGTNSDSGNGSGNASENGSASVCGTTGHSTETLPGLAKTSTGDDHVQNGRVTNGKVANSVSRNPSHAVPEMEAGNPNEVPVKNRIHLPPPPYSSTPESSAHPTSEQANSRGQSRVGQSHPSQLRPLTRWSAPKASQEENGRSQNPKKYSSDVAKSAITHIEQKNDPIRDEENMVECEERRTAFARQKDTSGPQSGVINSCTEEAHRASEQKERTAQEAGEQTKQLTSSGAASMQHPGSSNSLHVLSDCVDMVSRDDQEGRHPASGWAAAAAARRAHRAKVIRARKPPLPSGPEYGDGDLGSDNQVQVSDANDASEYQNEKPAEDAPAVKRKDGMSLEVITEARMQSPSVRRERSPPTVPPDESNRCSQDPQRSSAGSGSNSDDAIAGFSISDRPSVSEGVGGLSSRGSGSGGSIENSDAGEEEPKSSNDGSGDDVNRASPPTRDSSPADPTSAGSRENTPNGSSTDNNGNGGIRSSAEECTDPANGSGNELKLEGKLDNNAVPIGNDDNQMVGDPSRTRHNEEPGFYVGRNVIAAPTVQRAPHSIQSLCSDTPQEPEKFGTSTDLDSALRKRARSPTLNGTVHHAPSRANNIEVAQDLSKRQCHRSHEGLDSIGENSEQGNVMKGGHNLHSEHP